MQHHGPRDRRKTVKITTFFQIVKGKKNAFVAEVCSNLPRIRNYSFPPYVCRLQYVGR
jgi:hypothetical protein